MGDIEIKKIFSKNFNRLMSLHNKNQKDISEDLGYHRATVSEWARGAKYPRMDKVERLAQYFQVQISELIDDAPALPAAAPSTLPELAAKEERNIQKKLTAIIEGLTPNSGLAFFDDEQPMTEEDKELLRISLENTLRLSRQMAKQKFTPKKYRKE